MSHSLKLLLLPIMLIALTAGLAAFGAEDAAPATATDAVDPITLVDDSANSAAEAAPETNALWDLMDSGGWPMWALAILLVFSIIMVLFNFITVVLTSMAPPALVKQADQLWQNGDYEAVKKLAQRNGSALGAVIAWLADHHDASHAIANEGAGEVASRELRSQNQNTYWLAVIATLSPLLGLLGTIIGMIKAFDVIAIAGDIGDMSLVAGGISQALVTTAFGLIIAVPSLGFFHLFKVVANKASIGLEIQCSKCIDSWFKDKN